MLGLLKQALETGNLKIHAEGHDKLLLFLYGCNDTELIIDSNLQVCPFN
jgi:hypothetical protein